jgi:hypothetical protein
MNKTSAPWPRVPTVLYLKVKSSLIFELIYNLALLSNLTSSASVIWLNPGELETISNPEYSASSVVVA